MSKPFDTRIRWYRTPLDKETLAKLNAKSDLKGLAQSLGHVGLLCLTGGAALYGVGHWPWWVVLLIVYCHGTVASFAINAVHELVHKSVFKTQWLNQFFVRVFGFQGWIHFDHFYASHVRHHQFTLHRPDDLEVTLPIKIMTQQFYKWGFVSLGAVRWVLGNTWRLARGKFGGEWELRILPEEEPAKRKAVIGWARFLLIGHSAILIVSIINGWWLLPILTSCTPMYGSLLHMLCNNTQHIGLQDDVPDFRFSCRTFTVNPLVQFLYWHMNFHIEHHMYAAVPCYNLGKLHRAIEHELPPTPNGIIAVWKDIAAIQKLQAENPEYQHVALVPGRPKPEAGFEQNEAAMAIPA